MYCTGLCDCLSVHDMVIVVVRARASVLIFFILFFPFLLLHAMCGSKPGATCLTSPRFLPFLHFTVCTVDNIGACFREADDVRKALNATGRQRLRQLYKEKIQHHGILRATCDPRTLKSDLAGKLKLITVSMQLCYFRLSVKRHPKYH